jgi:hypothetical protein
MGFGVGIMGSYFRANKMKPTWEIEFDKQFKYMVFVPLSTKDKYKDFIRTQIEMAEKRGKDLQRKEDMHINWDKEAIKKIRQEARKEVIKEVDKLILEEMLICYKEGTPTSRLTSLSVKL